MIWFVIWLIGLWLVSKIVKPFEAGYGFVTFGAMFIWTLLSLSLAAGLFK